MTLLIKNGRLIRSGTMDEVRGDDSLEEIFLELAEPGISGGADTETEDKK